MNVDGSQQTQLTADPASCREIQAEWSPDGNQIAFAGNQKNGAFQVYVMRADGSNQKQLTSAGAANSPGWSPDGRKIAFAGSRNGNGDVYIMNADGTGQMPLTSNPETDTNAAWAP